MQLLVGHNKILRIFTKTWLKQKNLKVNKTCKNMDFVREMVLPVISSERLNIPVFQCLVLSQITVIST